MNGNQRTIGRLLKVRCLLVYFLLQDVDGNGEIATEEETMAANGDAEVLQRNHYYPFGLRVESPSFQNLGDPANRYLYNGKEIQGEGDLEIGWLYYGARMYDPAVGRFTGVDPLASEPSNAATNTYAYVWNSPLKFIDPDGRHGESIHEDANGNVIAEYHDGDSNVYRHNDLGNNGQHIDGMRAIVDQRREIYNKTSGGGEVQIMASVANTIHPKKLWDSHLGRLLIPDAVEISLETNAYVFGGVSTKPIGGLLILHGPEAGSFHTFTDVGAGGGVEASGGFSLDFSRVLTLDADNVRSEDFAGFRTSGSLDVGYGIIGGVNMEINNPTGNSPFIISAGVSIGGGATSPFGIGGNVNEGYTILHQ